MHTAVSTTVLARVKGFLQYEDTKMSQNDIVIKSAKMADPLCTAMTVLSLFD